MVDYVFPHSEITKVVDGDTFYADLSKSIDFGFHIKMFTHANMKFRLDGCNAAPISTPSGAAAAKALALMVASEFVTITSLGPYKYGDEWMARVAMDDGQDLTTWMIEHQYSAPWTGKGPVPLPPWPRTV